MPLLSSMISGQILTSLAMLYLMLGAASVGVGLRTRQRPQSRLRAQVYAWWWIFPVVTLSLALHPLGAGLLALLIAALALRELLPLGRRAPLLVWPLWALLCISVSFLPLYERLPLPPAQRFGWLFYLYVLTALNDVAQFISGSLFGRHRIAPGISPNKTWQGLAGGVGVTLLLSLALGGYLGLAPASGLALLAVLLSLGGFGGDLLFSAAKRKLGVKDFSTLIPGHGGILDRVDSLVVTAPLLYLFLRMMHES
ncbi:phosphatidate cytidylyltransferase [Duganella sp. P38]|uniref:phosphatidate cytidylyltransferase n=1 Tax=Duganella sp. P38 TaxID=3423949 RepID=UPI003D7A8839